MRLHLKGAALVRAVVPQPDGCRFKTLLEHFYVEFPRSPCVCVGFPRVLQPPIDQNMLVRLMVTMLPIGVIESVNGNLSFVDICWTGDQSRVYPPHLVHWQMEVDHPTQKSR